MFASDLSKMNQVKEKKWSLRLILGLCLLITQNSAALIIDSFQRKDPNWGINLHCFLPCQNLVPSCSQCNVTADGSVTDLPWAARNQQIEITIHSTSVAVVKLIVFSHSWCWAELKVSLLGCWESVKCLLNGLHNTEDYILLSHGSQTLLASCTSEQLSYEWIKALLWQCMQFSSTHPRVNLMQLPQSGWTLKSLDILHVKINSGWTDQTELCRIS